MIQRKAGSFTLDRCADCRHVFQNPQLNEDGLAFYYRDFYDGFWEARAKEAFAGQQRAYRRRAEFVARHAAPRTWLDVGTGHGHFCETAAATFPGTAFDGLDRGDGVELAERQGRIRLGYRGLFPELAPTLADGYDMVSMQHYLEHSVVPQRELDAAARVVRPGGHLFIEVPDPECRYGRLLGRWWNPWFQPQHLHLVPLPNLRRYVEELGFTVIAEERCFFDGPLSLQTAAGLLMFNTAPPEDAPWRPVASTRLRTAVRVAALGAMAPLLIAAALADHLTRLLPPRARVTDAYRLLARKPV
ncbi:class I SAM-dependent methyltransferase [Streptomyces kaniharaensis]|uniref:class I SAM-dependent methyltransferase n=1 Tax=Streptomyces kaniharaensis TaxID=212423 RepID=UPI001E5E3B48|nr:class I SAM-dependent methyltransferase [Streptomyces kaniharaensis]